MIPTTNMVIASRDDICVQVFVADLETSTDFAAYLQAGGWDVEIHPDVKEEEHPRIEEEVAIADGLMQAYTQWKAIACARSNGV